MYTKVQIDNDDSITCNNSDSSNYAKKNDVPTNNGFGNMTSVVANKLDRKPMHTHDIKQINLLETILNDKLDNTKQYSYKTLLNDTKKINYLELLTTGNLKVGDYILKMNSSGDINVLLNSNVIGSYVLSNGKLVFHGISDDLNILYDAIENYKEAIETLNEALNNKVEKLHTHLFDENGYKHTYTIT